MAHEGSAFENNANGSTLKVRLFVHTCIWRGNYFSCEIALIMYGPPRPKTGEVVTHVSATINVCDSASAITGQCVLNVVCTSCGLDRVDGGTNLIDIEGLEHMLLWCLKNLLWNWECLVAYLNGTIADPVLMLLHFHDLATIILRAAIICTVLKLLWNNPRLRFPRWWVCECDNFFFIVLVLFLILDIIWSFSSLKIIY